MIKGDLFIEMDFTDGTKAIQYSMPMKFTGTQGQIRRSAFKIGQDTEKLMSEFQLKRRQK